MFTVGGGGEGGREGRGGEGRGGEGREGRGGEGRGGEGRGGEGRGGVRLEVEVWQHDLCCLVACIYFLFCFVYRSVQQPGSDAESSSDEQVQLVHEKQVQNYLYIFS